MKRFYLQYTEGLESVSVKLRSNHDVLYVTLKLNDKDDVKTLKALYKMSEVEFLSLVREKLGDRPLRQHKELTVVSNKEHAEEWYKGAWAHSTVKVEKMLKLPESPEMDEESFFEMWKEQVENEKRLIAEQKKRELEESRKAQPKSKLKKKVVVEKKEAEEDEIDIDLDAMVNGTVGALIKKDSKPRLVKKTKKALKRKEK